MDFDERQTKPPQIAAPQGQTQPNNQLQVPNSNASIKPSQGSSPVSTAVNNDKSPTQQVQPQTYSENPGFLQMSDGEPLIFTKPPLPKQSDHDQFCRDFHEKHSPKPAPPDEHTELRNKIIQEIRAQVSSPQRAATPALQTTTALPNARNNEIITKQQPQQLPPVPKQSEPAPTQSILSPARPVTITPGTQHGQPQATTGTPHQGPVPSKQVEKTTTSSPIISKSTVPQKPIRSISDQSALNNLVNSKKFSKQLIAPSTSKTELVPSPKSPVLPRRVPKSTSIIKSQSPKSVSAMVKDSKSQRIQSDEDEEESSSGEEQTGEESDQQDGDGQEDEQGELKQQQDEDNEEQQQNEDTDEKPNIENEQPQQDDENLDGEQLTYTYEAFPDLQHIMDAWPGMTPDNPIVVDSNRVMAKKQFPDINVIRNQIGTDFENKNISELTGREFQQCLSTSIVQANLLCNYVNLQMLLLRSKLIQLRNGTIVDGMEYHRRLNENLGLSMMMGRMLGKLPVGGKGFPIERTQIMIPEDNEPFWNRSRAANLRITDEHVTNMKSRRTKVQMEVDKKVVKKRPSLSPSSRTNNRTILRDDEDDDDDDDDDDNNNRSRSDQEAIGPNGEDEDDEQNDESEFIKGLTGEEDQDAEVISSEEETYIKTRRGSVVHGKSGNVKEKEHPHKAKHAPKPTSKKIPSKFPDSLSSSKKPTKKPLQSSSSSSSSTYSPPSKQPSSKSSSSSSSKVPHRKSSTHTKRSR
ncbi:MAG: hypothetical protein EZS28_004095 [Streblomastix strix]|uniref:Uncharacterized protein n=1 Tax=Streblomastix strix TaxID=222440 RepID=A0A5J4WZM4_9EUKA|nr:MAG: hypothetical protein EZS28_004095 [Streblomastix strix]